MSDRNWRAGFIAGTICAIVSCLIGMELGAIVRDTFLG